MTQRQYDSIAALRRAVAVSGKESDEARLAAIEVCYAHGRSPHFRYALWPDLTEPPSNEPMLKPVEVRSEAEWQRVLSRVVAEAHS
jgi:hypothetical protein